MLRASNGPRTDDTTSPGLISAASSNDPTTVATLAVIGATTGYTLCWLVVLSIAMLAVVQTMAAAVGAACRTSVQGALLRRFGLRWAVATLCAIVAVNTITLVADIKAGSEAVTLLTGINAAAFVLPFGVTVGLLLVTHSFKRIERILQLLPLAFLCYVASAIIAHFDAGAALRGVFVPRLTPSVREASMAVALLGTILTSYVYVWESIEVAERRPAGSWTQFYKRDAALGILIVGIIFLFIVVASAATLGKHHLVIATADDMARALTPLAGPWSGRLFGIGLLSSAILVVPILAGSNAYVFSHTLGWPGDLNCSFRKAKRFYAVILGSLLLASIAALAPLPLVGLLYWASIAGGLSTPLTLYFLVRLACDSKTMGQARIGTALASTGWIVGCVVTLAAAIFLVTASVTRTS